jgi:hypothetical protein
VTSGQLYGDLFLAALGLWWLFFPNSAIRVYRALGNRQLERIGPGVVRVVGAIGLAVVITASIALMHLQKT